MALTRKPAIGVSRDLPRSAQGVIDAIRARIEAIEKLLLTVSDTANVASNANGVANASISNLQAQISQLASDLAALTISSGETVTLVADGAVALGDVVFPSSSTEAKVVDPSDTLSIYAAIGVATQSAANGAQLVVRRFGVMSVPFTSLVVGRAVYADIGGGLTQTAPLSGVAIPAGVAVADDEVYVFPMWPLLQFADFDPGFEQDLPVTKLYVDIATDQPIEEIFVDTIIGPTTRLAIIDASADDILVTLPSGLVNGGGSTRELTLYRRDSPSGPGGNVVSIVTQSGETIDGIYETVLIDRENRSFMAIGAPGWIETT